MSVRLKQALRKIDRLRGRLFCPLSDNSCPHCEEVCIKSTERLVRNVFEKFELLPIATFALASGDCSLCFDLSHIYGTITVLEHCCIVSTLSIDGFDNRLRFDIDDLSWVVSLQENNNVKS